MLSFSHCELCKIVLSSRGSPSFGIHISKDDSLVKWEGRGSKVAVPSDESTSTAGESLLEMLVDG